MMQFWKHLFVYLVCIWGQAGHACGRFKDGLQELVLSFNHVGLGESNSSLQAWWQVLLPTLKLGREEDDSIGKVLARVIEEPELGSSEPMLKARCGSSCLWYGTRNMKAGMSLGLSNQPVSPIGELLVQ